MRKVIINRQYLVYKQSAPFYVSPRGKKFRQAVFTCTFDNCGNEKVLRDGVKFGSIKTCGSGKHREIKYEKGFLEPLTYLEYIEDAEPYVLPSGKTMRQAKYKCIKNNCGNEKVLRIAQVRPGDTITCGDSNHLKIDYETGFVKPGTYLKFLKEVEPGIDVNGSNTRNALYECFLKNCGNQCIKPINNVKSGLGGTTNCGLHHNTTQFYIYDKIVIPKRPDAVWEFKLSNGQFADIAIPCLKIIIEYDGNQHSEVMHYDDGDISKLKERKQYDLKKNVLIKDIGWKLLRIPQKDYQKNKNKWKEIIENFIKEAQDGS